MRLEPALAWLRCVFSLLNHIATDVKAYEQALPCSSFTTQQRSTLRKQGLAHVKHHASLIYICLGPNAPHSQDGVVFALLTQGSTLLFEQHKAFVCRQAFT